MKIVGDNIYLRFLEASDAVDMLELNLRNREFFQRVSVTRSEDYYKLDNQIQIINDNNLLMDRDKRYAFGIFLIGSERLIGSIGLFNVHREPIPSCILGYSLDKGQNGRGYMTEAVKLTIDFAFDEIKLHRIEAGVMPRNIGSARVLEKAGFQRREGELKNVEINGVMEGHQIFEIISDNFKY